MRAGFWEILLIIILVLVLFGHAKIPDMMKNLANGINIFKKELKSKGGNNKKQDADAGKPVIKQMFGKKMSSVVGKKRTSARKTK